LSDLELLIALVAVAAVLARLADAAGIPYPIVLVLAGLAIGFVPGSPGIELDPDVIFLVFLPALLFAAGYTVSPQALRAELGALAGLVFGLSLLSMVAVAAAARYLIPELDWGEALVLGAIVAPTDPVAAVATFSRVGAPERVSTLVEGEALLNDGVALVAYRVAVAAALTGGYSAGDAVVDLTLGVAGGVAIGLALAGLAMAVQRRLDDVPLSITLSLILPYVAYIASEEIGASGILAAVASGLVVSWYSHEVFDPDRRLSGAAFFGVFVFALEAILFLLVGLQFPEILRTVGEDFSPGTMVLYGALIGAAVIAVRIAWQFLPPALSRLVPAVGALDTGRSWQERLVVGWSGMRGAVSLAAALALPLELDSGAAFADRGLIIYLTVAVILLTLVVQGLTLPALIRRLGQDVERPWAPEEAIARLAAAQAALDRLEEIETERYGVPPDVTDRLRELYRARFERSVAALTGEGEAVPIEDPIHGFRQIRRELIGTERRALVAERDSGRLKLDVLRQIERDLDLEEARLR
jgi:Na+/H+ antiporter